MADPVAGSSTGTVAGGPDIVLPPAGGQELAPGQELSFLRRENELLRARLAALGRTGGAGGGTAGGDDRSSTDLAEAFRERSRLLDDSRRQTQVRTRQLARSETRLRSVRAELGRRRRELERVRQRLIGLTDELARARTRIGELEQAEHDVRTLVDRLGETPAAPILRRRSGYRAIEARWRR